MVLIEPIIFKYPLGETLNPLLQSVIKTSLTTRLGGGKHLGARRTDFNFHHKNIPALNTLIKWLESLFTEVGKHFSLPRIDQPSYSFTLETCWGIIYDKDSCVIEHNHFPYAFSFSYYVVSPSDTAPLVVNEQSYYLKAGDCIFFPSLYPHEVKPSQKEGRTVIVGNAFWAMQILKEKNVFSKK